MAQEVELIIPEVVGMNKVNRSKSIKHQF